MDALQRANEIRSKRAQLKRDLKGSRASIHQLLLDPPEWVETAKVQAAYENLIGAALNKREKEQLNTLLRRLMVEFERREGDNEKKP